MGVMLKRWGGSTAMGCREDAPSWRIERGVASGAAGVVT